MSPLPSQPHTWRLSSAIQATSLASALFIATQAGPLLAVDAQGALAIAPSESLAAVIVAGT
jgi:hypothetical protein